MERSNIIVIAVVIAALAFFGLQFFSGSDDAELLASRGELGTDAGGSGPGGSFGDGGGGGAAGDARRARLGGFGADGRPGGGGGGTRPGIGYGNAGAAGVVPGGARSGGSVGVSGSSGAGGGTGGSASIAGGSGGSLGPRPQRKDDIVDSLSSRPPTKSDLDAPPPVDNGDDIALKVDKTEDISEQAGQAEGEVTDGEEEEGILVPENGRVEFPNAGNASSEGSISFTIKPEWAGTDPTDNALVQIRQEHEWNNRLEIVKNGEFLRFILTDNTGKEADISVRISDWQANQEQILEFSWGEGRTEASINNQVVGRNEYPGELQFSQGTPMFFGSDHVGSNYGSARARINQFTVSRVPLFR